MSRTTRGHQVFAETVTGAAALRRLAPELEELAARTGAPVSATPAWQLAWADAHPRRPPTVLTVRREGTLAGAAVLAVQGRAPLARVSGYPPGETDRLRLPAIDDGAALQLAVHLTGWLHTLRRPWILHLEQLPRGDAVAAVLAARLPGSALEPGDPCPLVRLEPDRPAGSRNLRKQVGKGRRRAESDGLAVEVVLTRAWDDIAGHLEDLAAVRRSRDHDAGRVSGLDRAEGEGFWRAVIEGFSRRGALELGMLRLGGSLAAYNVALLDGGVYRLWDGRFDPAFAHCYPGLVLDAELFAAAASAGFAVVDFGRGATPYKLRWADDSEETVRLRAWSSGAARLAHEAPRRARRAVAGWLTGDPRRRAAYHRVKGTLLWRSRNGGPDQPGSLPPS